MKILSTAIEGVKRIFIFAWNPWHLKQKRKKAAGKHVYDRPILSWDEEFNYRLFASTVPRWGSSLTEPIFIFVKKN